MVYTLTNVKRKVHDLLLACHYVAMPLDRPSPIFLMLDVCINGALVVWGFELLVSDDCYTRNKAWMALGMVHSFMNMMFGIAIMAEMRRSIKKGIELDTRYLELFLLCPYVIAYLVYLVWEILWMIIVLSGYPPSSNADRCNGHLFVQCCFYLAYFVVGLGSFTLTFATEWLALPRWRERANTYWALNHRQTVPNPNHFSVSQDCPTTLLANPPCENVYYSREAPPAPSIMRKPKSREDVCRDCYSMGEALSTSRLRSIRSSARSMNLTSFTTQSGGLADREKSPEKALDPSPGRQPDK